MFRNNSFEIFLMLKVKVRYQRLPDGDDEKDIMIV